MASEFSVRLKGLDSVLAACSEGENKKAARLTIKKMLDSSRTAIAAADGPVRSIYTIKPTKLTAKMKTEIRVGEWGRAALIVSGGPLPIADYDATLGKTRVAARVKVASTKKTIAHAFTATMRSGHKGAFQRGWWRPEMANKFKKPPPGWMANPLGAGGPAQPDRPDKIWAAIGFPLRTRRFVLPIKEVEGPSAPDLVNQPAVFQLLQQHVRDNVQKFWEQSVAFYNLARP